MALGTVDVGPRQPVVQATEAGVQSVDVGRRPRQYPRRESPTQTPTRTCLSSPEGLGSRKPVPGVRRGSHHVNRRVRLGCE